VKTDAQLVKEARRDPDALGELYRRHVARIHAWLSSRVPPAAAAELTAETFAQAALSLRRFRDEADGSALPWLYGIARNLLRRSLERNRLETAAGRRLRMPVGEHEPDATTLAERARAERLRPQLAAALDGLPEGQRRALELRVVDELPYREVASSQRTARLRCPFGPSPAPCAPAIS